MKIEIKSIAGSVLFEGDFSCIADAVKAAVKSSADLSSADLSSANLRSADLSYANLSYANLRSADLSSADLSSADLRSADLSSADLRSADLSSADLRSADLSSADLSYANLSSANLSYADLSYADLSYAKADYFDVLLRSKNEVGGLREAIIDGRIEGSQYEGECACLVGTIAKVAHVHYGALPHLKPDSSRPSERLFLAIRKGDTPATNPVSEIVLKWTDEFITLLNA